MQFSQDDFDRLLLSEHSRKTAEAHYAKNPLDADNLVKWAGALLELSQFQSVADSKIMLNDCISKLEEALVINPTKHEALWAAEEEPGNELYQKSIEVTAKAPELHMEIHKQGMAQQTLGGGPAASSSGKSSKAKRSSDLKYDICGWIILAVGIVAWVGLAKSNMPPPPPPR
ncbi:hypothetical protein M0R45_021528 [Rubus argutus]|uniref:Uncharacterized protein n=1 Tax=Rubus argutus TaxID=59490 RepID=A0AAW1XF63_RUBAR